MSQFGVASVKMSEPILMPTKSTPKAPAHAKKRFSLVPEIAQRSMYEALSQLKRTDRGKATGCEVAEVAVCTAIDTSDPVILACNARGARLVREDAIIAAKGEGRFEAAALTAIRLLLQERKSSAVICAGKLEFDNNSQADYRKAFEFAARYRLPLLFVIANTYDSGQPETDLRILSAELGIPVFTVDFKDAIAAYRVTTEALHNARHLRGPSIIEALRVDVSDKSALDLLKGYMERHGNWPL